MYIMLQVIGLSLQGSLNLLNNNSSIIIHYIESSFANVINNI